MGYCVPSAERRVQALYHIRKIRVNQPTASEESEDRNKIRCNAVACESGTCPAACMPKTQESGDMIPKRFIVIVKHVVPLASGSKLGFIFLGGAEANSTTNNAIASMV